MARQSAGRRNADDELAETEIEQDDELDEDDESEDEEDEDTGEPEDVERSAETDALWSAVKIDVVELALPKGVGYTLRAYRLDNELTPTDISEREGDAFPDRERPVRRYVTDEKAILDEDDDETDTDEDVDDEYDEDEEDLDSDRDDDEDLADEDDGDDGDDGEDEDDEEPEAAAEPEAEEVPIFLGRRGQLYVFQSAEGLVDFVRSGADHDMSQLATWSELVEKITAEDVVPLAEDRYELDLVVDNLRSGHDGWDPELLIQAGEVARDLGYALRLEQVMSSLAPGSPLDDLDEAMRAAAAGGIGGFMARRKLKKIGAEAAPLGWRTIIGKISAVVDWRD